MGWGNWDGIGWHGVTGMGWGGWDGMACPGWGARGGLECPGRMGCPGCAAGRVQTVRDRRPPSVRVRCPMERRETLPRAHPRKRPGGFGDRGSGEPLLKGLPMLRSRAGRGLPAEPARLGLMPTRTAGRASPRPFPLRSSARRFSVSFFPLALLILPFRGAAMCSRPPQVPPGRPPRAPSPSAAACECHVAL